MTIDEPLDALVKELTQQLQTDDMKYLLKASKDESIKAEELKQLSTPQEWLRLLVNKILLTKDDLSFIEHVFELCRRPDLLAIILEYRTKHLNMDKITPTSQQRRIKRLNSSEKYARETPGNHTQIRNFDDVKLSDPPKTRRKSTAT